MEEPELKQVLHVLDFDFVCIYIYIIMYVYIYIYIGCLIFVLLYV